MVIQVNKKDIRANLYDAMGNLVGMEYGGEWYVRDINENFGQTWTNTATGQTGEFAKTTTLGLRFYLLA